MHSPRSSHHRSPHAASSPERYRSPLAMPGAAGSVRTKDISFLADDAAGHARRVDEWRTFRKQLDGRRQVPARAAPPQARAPVPGGSSSSPWAREGYTQASVAATLFGTAHARDVLGTEVHRPPAPASAASGVPKPGQKYVGVPSSVELFEDASSSPEPAGRAQALQLATALARDAGAAPNPSDGPHAAWSVSERAAAALSAKVVPENVGAAHAAILELNPSDVVPQLELIDSGAVELVRQVSAQCTEQALLLEYIRRHQVESARTARALLCRLQETVAMYEELRRAVDDSMLQRFTDSLGDAFEALRSERPEEVPATRADGGCGKGRVPARTDDAEAEGEAEGETDERVATGAAMAGSPGALS